MTTEEILALTGRELDGAVALALGWRIKASDSNPRLIEFYKPGADDWSFCCVKDELEQVALPFPDYSTDPADADLVRQEIERRWKAFNIGHFIYHFGTAETPDEELFEYQVDIRTVQGARAEHKEYAVALCHAFLLAHHAEKEHGGE